MKEELQKVLEKYEGQIPKDAYGKDGRVNTEHEGYKKVKEEWQKEMNEVRQKYRANDWREKEINDIFEKNPGLKEGVPNTGGNIKEINSDLDFSPKTPDAARDLMKELKARGYEPVDMGDHWRLPESDVNVWKPPSDSIGSSAHEAAIANKAKHGSDAWTNVDSTTGKSAVDPGGDVLANANKASDAINRTNPGESDLHTAGKSLDKAADAAKTDDFSPREGKPDLYKQAKGVREHLTPEEAGVTTFGESSGFKQGQTEKFVNEVQSEFGNLYKNAKGETDRLQTARSKNAQKAYDEGNTELGNEIKSTKVSVQNTNDITLNELAVKDPAMFEKLTGVNPNTPAGREYMYNRTGDSIWKTTVEGGAPPSAHTPVPGEGSVGEAMKKWGGRSMDTLMILNMGMSAWDAEKEKAMWEGREPSKVMAVKGAIWDGLLLGSYRETSSILDEELAEADRKYGDNHWQIEARARAALRGFSSILGISTQLQISDEEIRAEEARARAAGEEPSYLRSTYNSGIRGIGEIIGYNGICRSLCRDWEAEKRWADSERVMAAFVAAKTQGKLEQAQAIRERIEAVKRITDPNSPYGRQRIAQLNDELNRTIADLRYIASRMRKLYSGEDPRTKMVYDALGKALGRTKGKRGYIGVEQLRSDWYCTNRPNIEVSFPPPRELTSEPPKK